MSDIEPTEDAFEEGDNIVEQDDDGVERALFTVEVEGFEGPIDVLLTLARDQKVDLTQISILKLADQYLGFVQEARKRNLELAADYLVMAAWLAYLKSRLLLPDMDKPEEPSGEELAAALQFQLQRLESMQKAGQELLSLSRLGRDRYGRGQPEKFSNVAIPVIEVTLFDLLKAYGQQKSRGHKVTSLRVEAFDLYTVEDALKRLKRFLGAPVPDWQDLWKFLPPHMAPGLVTRSALASTFTATLELCREGKLEIRQDGTFGPIELRAKPTTPVVVSAPAPSETNHE